MFEDINDKNLNENNPKPSANKEESNANQHPTAPKEEVEKIEDIFATTDNRGEAIPSPEKPAVFQPKEKTPMPESVVQENNNEQGNISNNYNKYIKIGGIGIAVIIVLAGSWYGYNRFFLKYAPSEMLNTNEGVIEEEIEDNNSNYLPDNEENLPPTERNTEEPTQEEPVQSLDSDQDGLTDEEERELGMNINNVDTDDDGLFDREEVKVYKTNPLNADTDGDGFLDGAEVNNGYNPKGSGLLYERN